MATVDTLLSATCGDQEEIKNLSVWFRNHKINDTNEVVTTEQLQ